MTLVDAHEIVWVRFMEEAERVDLQRFTRRMYLPFRRKKRSVKRRHGDRRFKAAKRMLEAEAGRLAASLPRGFNVTGVTIE